MSEYRVGPVGVGYGAPLTQPALAGGKGDRAWFETRLIDFSQELSQLLGG